MSLHLDEPSERHAWVGEAVTVAALLGSAILGISILGPDGERPDDGVALWVADVAVVAGSLVMFRGRRHPRTAVAVTTACAVLAGSLGFLLTPLLLAPVMLALYWLAAVGSSRTAWIHGSVCVVAIVITAIGFDWDEMVALRAAGPALWLVLPLVMGNRYRLRFAYHDAVRARAEHAERTREEEARLRVTEERMRIARDLHDVVAHHMAVANAQAGTAAHLLGTDPNLSRRILADLQENTSAAMLELRDTLRVLRHSSPDTDDLAPAPGLAELPALVETCRSAGLAVDVEVRGAALELPPGIDLTAYRIIQEALTNATKYSASGTATLVLTYTAARLTVSIMNEVAPRADPPGTPGENHQGFGLVGMRERARSVGGSLEVAESPSTRFEVVTDLPLRSNAPRPVPSAPVPQVAP